MPAAGKKESGKDLGTQIPEGQISKTVYKGSDNKAAVRLLYSGNYNFNRENNIQLSAPGAILQYRMIDRIRELEGGANTPQAGVSYNKLPRNRYAVSVQFTCAPGSVEKLVTAANEEIEKIKTGGVTAEDVAKFTAEQTRSTETQMQTNQF